MTDHEALRQLHKMAGASDGPGSTGKIVMVKDMPEPMQKIDWWKLFISGHVVLNGAWPSDLRTHPQGVGLTYAGSIAARTSGNRSTDAGVE